MAKAPQIVSLDYGCCLRLLISPIKVAWESAICLVTLIMADLKASMILTYLSGCRQFVELIMPA